MQIYKEGDLVVHPGHGGCTVQGICTRKIAGQTKNYYILIPKSDPNTTILDPVDSVREIGLRDIISSAQADQIISHTSSAPTDWVSDNAKRRQTYNEIFKSGSLTSIATMIKELIVRGTETGLNQYDKDLLPKAQKKLLSEIALAKGIEFEGAVSMMNQAILQRTE